MELANVSTHTTQSCNGSVLFRIGESPETGGVRDQTVRGVESINTPPSIEAVLAAIARRQHGLLRIAQLLAAGLSHATILKWVRRGRLHRVLTGIYALGNPGLSREGRLLSAVFAGGEGAALARLSAAELCKVSRWRPARITVVSTHQRRSTKEIHFLRANRLHPRDVTTRDGIPVTSMARTLVDLSDVQTPYQLANVIHEAAFLGHFSELATRDAIQRANGRHNLHVVEKALRLHADGSAGTRSRYEDAFLALIPSLDLPEPRVTTDLHGFEVDVHWPELRLAVEVDGLGHGRPRSMRDDADQDRTLQAAGYTVLRFTGEEVEQRPRKVLSRLRTELARDRGR
jgi:predicted transcriptional regulator of viral defense system